MQFYRSSDHELYVEDGYGIIMEGDARLQDMKKQVYHGCVESGMVVLLWFCVGMGTLVAVGLALLVAKLLTTNRKVGELTKIGLYLIPRERYKEGKLRGVVKQL